MATIEYLSPLSANEFVEQWYEIATVEHFWMQWRFLAARNFLLEKGFDFGAPLKVLDVGSGNGALRAQLERATFWTIDCADLNEAGLKQSASGRGGTFYYNIEDRAHDRIGKYDLVLAFDVIEHLADPTAFLEAARDHLKVGGQLLVNVPALPALFSRYDVCVGHFRRYDSESLRGALALAGFTSSAIRFWGASLVPVLAVRKILLSLFHSKEKVVAVGFEPPHAWVQSFFCWLAKCETQFIRRPRWGSSVLAMAARA
jgi:SAM-dependent methyltransferase